LQLALDREDMRVLRAHFAQHIGHSQGGETVARRRFAIVGAISNLGVE
jgi:hypothetical protein